MLLGEFSKRVRWLWRTLWRSKQLEAEMREEMRLHIEMEADRLRANGLDPEEARRQRVPLSPASGLTGGSSSSRPRRSATPGTWTSPPSGSTWSSWGSTRLACWRAAASRQGIWDRAPRS
jgi:hypothetical protein